MIIQERIAKLYGEAGEEVHQSSVIGFFNFLEFLDNYRRIGADLKVSLTPDNEIYASWQIGRNRYSFRFYDEKSITQVSLITRVKK